MNTENDQKKKQTRNFVLICIFFFLLLYIPHKSSELHWKTHPWTDSSGQLQYGIPGYGLFPAQQCPVAPAPFYQPYYILAICIEAPIILFLLFPGLFGFKRSKIAESVSKTLVGYPRWFIPSLIVVLVSWLAMWSRYNALDRFAFVPLWWGFIFLLDAIVYKRNNGKSLISSIPPGTFKTLAAISAVSWGIYEYLNFFVCECWYYPNYKVFSNFGNICWQLMSYTTVLPAIFEWYWLLRTFKWLRDRYSNGPKITASRPVLVFLVLLGIVIEFLAGYAPNYFFWALWVGLIPIMVPLMGLLNIPTPFTPISKKGDWSFIVLIGIATVCNGFFWEFWNFGSDLQPVIALFHNKNVLSQNPNFWKYSVPFLGGKPFEYWFSEMPLVGYMGYFFFGISCWMLWLVFAKILTFKDKVTENDFDKD